MLAFACRRVDAPAVSLEDENDLSFLGLIAMMDPPREESKAAVAECIAAGIRPIMITGDHKITASAVPGIGILTEGTEAAEEVSSTIRTDEELKEFVRRSPVYARVSRSIRSALSGLAGAGQSGGHDRTASTTPRR